MRAQAGPARRRPGGTQALPHCPIPRPGRLRLGSGSPAGRQEPGHQQGGICLRVTSTEAGAENRPTGAGGPRTAVPRGRGRPAPPQNHPFPLAPGQPRQARTAAAVYSGLPAELTSNELKREFRCFNIGPVSALSRLGPPRAWTARIGVPEPGQGHRAGDGAGLVGPAGDDPASEPPRSASEVGFGLRQAPAGPAGTGPGTGGWASVSPPALPGSSAGPASRRWFRFQTVLRLLRARGKIAHCGKITRRPRPLRRQSRRPGAGPMEGLEAGPPLPPWPLRGMGCSAAAWGRGHRALGGCPAAGRAGARPTA